MKTLIYSFLLLSCMFYSQETYTFKSGGRVFENGERIKTSQIESTFKDKPEIVNLYKSGRTKKTVGNVFLYSGIGIIALKHYDRVKNQNVDAYGNTTKKESNVMYFVGAGISIVSIPIKIGFQKRIKKSVALMNEDANSKIKSTGFNYETNIMANSNGFGLKITF